MKALFSQSLVLIPIAGNKHGIFDAEDRGRATFAVGRIDCQGSTGIPHFICCDFKVILHGVVCFPFNAAHVGLHGGNHLVVFLQLYADAGGSFVAAAAMDIR